MKTLNIGSGNNPRPDAINLDRTAGPHVDVVFDLETCALGAPLPFDDDTFDEIHASHILEHITAILPLMQELWRVAKPGAFLHVNVPPSSSDMAWDDPTHVRAFGLNAFQFFSQPAYKRADYGYRGDWEPKLITLIMEEEVAKQFRSKEEAETAAIHGRNFVSEMYVLSVARKPARAVSEAETFPEIRIRVNQHILEPGNA